MRVKLVDNVSPRSDGKSGPPGDITLFQEYVVAAIEGDKYVIINDKGKMCRYNQNRFVVTCQKKPPGRDAYNYLSWPLRMELNKLRARVLDLQEELLAK